MRDYTQLTSEERYQIEALLKADHNQTEIASVLKRHKSTISREVGRNRGLHRYRPHASLVHTLTSDNGKEFSHHQGVAEELNADDHFAHPCHSWERRLNENTNGLIRQYLPKSTDFQTLTHKEVQDIMDKLNNRPRKCLGFKTPNQVFFGIKPPVALAS